MNTAMIGAQKASYEELLGKMHVVLLPAGRNQAMLALIPHKPMADLAAVFVDGEGKAVTNKDLQDLGISIEQFEKDALDAASKNCPGEMLTIEEALKLIDPDFPMDEGPAEWQLFVASNKERNYGAGVIAYPGFLDRAAEKLGGDFFVIPSSIHEVLFLRKLEAVTAADLDEIVHGVNATELKPNEVLSDHVYQYDRKTKSFEIAI